MAQSTTVKEKNVAGQTNIEFAIRYKYKPTDDQKKMLAYIYKRYYAMRGSKDRKDAELEWKKSIEQWEAARTPKLPDDWQSNHYVPLTSSIVESALAEVIDQTPQPMVLPRGDEDAPRAVIMEHILEYTWDVSDSDIALYNVVKNAFIFGTGIAQEYYYADNRKIQNKDGSEKDSLAYDDVLMENVRLEDFYIDPTARDFTGPYAARDCVRRYVMDIDDFKQFFQGPIWNPLDNAKYVIPGGDTSQYGGSTSYYQWYKPPQDMDQSRQVEVLWYWSVKPKDWLCVVANDVMVLMGPNPYEHKELPFARCIDIKRPHKFYGKGEAALLESTQDEVNTLRRMIIDRNHLDIDKMFFVSSKLNLTDEDTIARPHGTIPVDDLNAAKPIEYGDVPRSVELSLQHLEDDSTIATGINPRAQALPQAGTATEAAILKESTLKRIRLKVNLFLNKEFLTRIGRLRVANILQYYPETKMEKIVGEEATDTYQKDMADLLAKGFSDQGSDYTKRYKQIPIVGKKIDINTADGSLSESAVSGTTFFELRPEYFRPVARGGFNIKFVAGSTLPVSKTLMQSKATEMYDRLIQLAIAGIGYDPTKLGDLLLKVNDYNPNDFHTQDNSGGGGSADQTNLMLINLATTENKILMSGGKIAPDGTPFVPAAHTQVHVAFTGSPSFQALGRNDPKVKEMTAHIAGEIASQESRAGSGNPPPTQPSTGVTQGPLPPRPQTMVSNNAPTANLGGNPTLTSLLPSKIQGGAQVPM